MDVKKLLMGTVAGGITLYLIGFLLYGNLLMDFFQSHLGSATGVMKDPPDMVFLILAELIFGFLLTYIYMKWAGISTFSTGLKAGVLIGLLLGLHHAFISYATSNIMDLTGSIVDGLVPMVMVGLAGGVVGWVLGMGSSD